VVVPGVEGQPLRWTIGVADRGAGGRVVMGRLDMSGQPWDTMERWVEALRAAGERPRMVVNGGMFHGGATPVGLYTENAQTQTPLNRWDGSGNFYLLPNGVFAVTAAEWVVMETERWASTPRAGVRYATQSGPLLVHDGAFHPAFEPDSNWRNLRNGVCVVDGQRVALVMSIDPVTFWELASLMRDTLGCAHGLYLDGSISRTWIDDRAWPDGAVATGFGPMIALLEAETGE
jgi:uncharacterized protein YigE (DUF2233 family)